MDREIKKNEPSNKKEKTKKIETDESEIKDIYFIILYPRKEQEKPYEFTFSENDINPENIYTEEIKQENQIIIYKKVFKFNGRTHKKYKLEFYNGKIYYIITFEVKNNSFIYDIELKKGYKYLENNPLEIIDQKIIGYNKKLDIFLEALKRNNEDKKANILYKDTIDLYEEKKGFSFLISIFVKIYDNEELCKLLLHRFREMNDNKKNMDRNKDIEVYIKKINDIPADELIKNNFYNPIEFYGIILCYLNYYDYDNFNKILKHLSVKWPIYLYEILIIYSFHFLRPINQNLDFFVEFIYYCIERKEFYDFKIGLNYIRDIETFIIVIDRTKEKILEKYFDSYKSFKPIKLNNNLELIKKEQNREMNAIYKGIDSIIHYLEYQHVLFVYFESNFWTKILSDYNTPDVINIVNCYKLREIFKEYNTLVNKLCKNDKKSQFKEEINRYFYRDEFAFILNRNIKKLIETKNLSNSEILGFIVQYNPYYQEERYKYFRDISIFDYIDLDDNEKEFIESFKLFNFEIIFEDNIMEFLNKMISKIKNISNFNTILELINIKRISKVTEYYALLKDKYENVIKRQIESLTDKKLDNAVKILAKFIDLIYIHEKKCCIFIENTINKLDKNLCFLIYIELMRRCEGDEYKEMKKYIYKKILNKLEDNVNIIKFIDNLEKENKNDFFEELFQLCQFTKEEYFSNNENEKIALLCELNDKGKLKFVNRNIIYNIEGTLDEIFRDLDSKIPIKQLQEFLENDENQVIQRLKLINIILSCFDPFKIYMELKERIKKIKNIITKLNSIKNSLLIFHSIRFQKEIKEISNLINDIQENNLIYFYSYEKEEKIDSLMPIVDKVEKVKDFLLFEVLYDETFGSDQEKRFNNAMKSLNEIKDLFWDGGDAGEIYEKNKKIFNKIKEILSKNESKVAPFIQRMIDYFKIKRKELIHDLILIFKSKIYETDLKSIIYFFENFNFQKDNNNDKFYEKIDIKYKALSQMNLEDLKNSLITLKNNGIYDYETPNNNYRIFNCLYEKKEAIDYLIWKAKASENGKYQYFEALYEKLLPTNINISKNDIEDTEECIKTFIKFKKMDNNWKILEYIKMLNYDIISKFERYSKIYSSIIELERNNDSTLNLYKKVNNYIENATFIFRQDNKDFSYDEKGITNMEELIHIKNKIYIKPSKEKKETGSEDDSQKKCLKLVFFKDLISELEIIYEYMNFMRIKGSSLPILIIIKIKYPNIEYFLNKKETNLECIKKFLFEAKEDYINQLDSIYKQNKYLRFLYGKQFRNIIKHLDEGYNASDILRFILNKIDDIREIKDGTCSNPIKVEDYVTQYKIYNKNSFDNITNYLISLFENNDISFQKHYEKMLIKEKNEYKGIYLHECKEESMEEFIISTYMDKMNQLPIAQNILICNKETSHEEMQSFFYRAILCDYNTLFIVEINYSFSDFQQNLMYNYIDTILSYKYENYDNKNVKKSNTEEYLNSCIIFIYEQNNKENLYFLNELKRFLPKEIGYKYHIELTRKSRKSIEDDISNISLSSSIYESFEIDRNVKIITSDVSGLGKSERIKRMVIRSLKKYFYFPLGGFLSKTIIFKKLSELIKKINEENENNYKNIAIHLDLYESEEISTMNEFLFSFLITKFYTNNENIIHIPQDIEIYIEIQNCFYNYISKFGILREFTRENISLENMSPLYFREDIIYNMLRIMTGIEVTVEIEEFIKRHIGIEKYSYHQIIIFIKLFISQYSKISLTTKLKILGNNNEDMTQKYIVDFAKSTIYFTNGEFAKLFTHHKDVKDKDDYIEKLSEIYDKDFRNIKFDIPLIFILTKSKKIYEVNFSDSKIYESKQYLKKIKNIFELPNEVEKEINDKKSLLSILDYQTDNYVLTKDNFKKMILLLYKIEANLPVIVMGETGCGKTALITKLNQILNNGEKTLKIININPSITDEDICKYMRIIDEEAKKNKEKELWAFFDQMNTCEYLSLITEIFINRTYNGEKFSENIRLIGACNPYRKRKINTEKCGLSKDDDNENELVYLVQPLPQSLLYYVFNFGYICEEDEKIYISNIIENLFTKDEKKLHELTRDAIFECHKFLRNYFGESIVSLREISRFSKCFKFFQKYYTIKSEYENEINQIKYKETNDEGSKIKLFKIKSIICSIYLCYYIRLNYEKRAELDCILQDKLLKLVNVGEVEDCEEKGYGLLKLIKYKKLKNDLKEENIHHFSDLLKIEENFLLNQIELDKGIGKTIY